MDKQIGIRLPTYEERERVKGAQSHARLSSISG